jgi:NADPH:quinone reductase-like Zn-dependent oxidoreductase
VIDYTAEDPMNGSERYDVILDIGGNTPLRRLRRAMTRTGRLVFVGGENGGDWTGGFGRQLLAFALSPFVRQRFVMLASKEHHAHLDRLAALVDLGKVAPHIDRRVPLGGLVEAMHDLEAGRIRGKVVIAP